MKLLRLHLQAFGPFTDRWLDLGEGSVGLHLVCGSNEAGKSSALRALTALRHGIEMRSADNFVHEHARMSVGAHLLDRDGRRVEVVRRKGRGQTLSVRSADGELAPASADLELQLTGGLSRSDFESLYGLDHARLREGGEALLKGEGDVGAALFEASAGVRSLQVVVERLEQEARRQFVPGARGTRGRINEALKLHGEQATVLKEAMLRPTAWGDLQRRCEETGQALRTLLASQAALDQQARQWRERLAVVPLLARLDQALQRCAELAEAPALGEDATASRLALQAATAEQQQALATLNDTLARHQREWAALPASSAALLQAASTIERLLAQGESLDQQQRVWDECAAEQARLTHRLAEQLAAIDDTVPSEALRLMAPTAVVRAQAEAALSALAEAERALQQHQRTRRPPNATPATDEAVAGPVRAHGDLARVALRGACDAVVRAEAALARLAAVPAELAAAQQRLAEALTDLGAAATWRLAAVRAACPVLEVDIDQAVRLDDEGRTRLRELALRLAQIDEALRGRAAEREQLLAHGVVPTPDDVQTARTVRDEAWSGLRVRLAGDSVPAADDDALRRFEQSLRHADALADALARDAGRAAQLQALQRQIADLKRDRDLLKHEVQQLQTEQTARTSDWQARLRDAGLPALAPEALREWQARLRVARAAADQVDALALEEARLGTVAEQVRRGLRAALRTVLPETARSVIDQDDTPLVTLLALARQTEDAYAREEQAAFTRAAEQRLQHDQLQREQAEAQRLTAVCDAARAGLAAVCGALRLPGSADAVAVRARLQEWAQVGATAEQLAEAGLAHDRACRAVAELVRRAGELADSLQGAVPAPTADLRHWLDELAARLAEARQVEGRRQVLTQALAEAGERQQQHTAALHRLAGQLQGLCAAAGVATEAELPAAEERARQRREALQQRDHVRDLLAQVASSRDEAALRALVGALDVDQAQAEVQRCDQALADLAPQVDAARQHDEAARRARDAIDASDTAAQARERLAQADAAVRAGLGPWMRARLAQALLAQALRQFRERAQGPMLTAASACFATMTGGEYDRLLSELGGDDTRPVLQVQRRDGRCLGVEALSEGTRDQLYLALRLAALQMHRARGTDLPLVLDDVLMTSDDDRAVRVLQTLADFAEQGPGAQVLVFTHHRHLLDLARTHLPPSRLACLTL